MKPPPKDQRMCVMIRDFLLGLAVFLAVFTLAMLDSRASRSAPAVISKPTVTGKIQAITPANITTGTLLLQHSGDGTAVKLKRAFLIDTDVNIDISGSIARATLTQKFRNISNDQVEGIYAFPLPETASIDALSIQIGSHIVKGVITPDDEAQKMYKAAKDSGMSTGAVSRHSSKLFTSTLKNIGPGEEITVSIEYQEMLRGTGDTYSLRFPLVVAPRFALKPPLQPVKLDGRSGVSGPASNDINPVSLQVRLDSGFPLERVTSDTHEIAVYRSGNSSALVAFTQGHVPADRDFQLSWKSKKSDLPQTTVFHEQENGKTYVLAMLTPPGIDSEAEPAAREIVFVIDTSASMAGATLAQAKDSLAIALKRLRPGDRFNIIRFNKKFHKLFSAPAPVTSKNTAIASQFISRLEAQGGMEILPALVAALKDVRKADRGRQQQVVFFTEGAISSETELFSTLAAERGSARLFMVGLGPKPNSIAMRRIAEIGRGNYVHIPSQTQKFTGLNALFDRLDHQVITDLKLEWPTGVYSDVSPDPLPDIYPGEPLLVTAKVSALTGNLKLTGKIAGKPWSDTLLLVNAKKGSGVGKFWAKRRIASLEARYFAGQQASDVDSAIEAVAIEHGLVSRRTPMVVLAENSLGPERQPLASEALPVKLPAGRIHGTGEAGISSDPHTTTEPTVAPAKLAMNIGESGAGRHRVPGEPEATGRSWMLSVMALIFAAMSALTLALWRHLRQSVAPARTGKRV